MALASGCLLGGCSLHQERPELPFSAEGALPAAYDTRLEDDSAATQGWVADFESEELTTLIRAAVDENFDLQARAAQLKVALEQAAIAGAARLPSIQAGADASRRRTATSAPPPFDNTAARTTNNYGLSLNIRWEADIWGRLAAIEEAAGADATAAEAVFESAKLSLAARTAQTWFDAIAAQQQLELARETAESFSQSASVVRSRFERGVSPAIDVRLLNAQAANALAAVSAREQELDASLRLLQTLLGRYPAASQPVPEALPSLPAPVPAKIPSTLLARRPDILSAKANLLAADLRLAAAEKAFLPSIGLTGSGGRSSTELSDLLDPSNTVWSLAGSITQPIFEGGRLRAEARRNAAQLEQQVALYGQTVLNALREVETALAAEQLLRQRASAIAAAAEESIAAESLAWDRYSRGVSDIITVLESQRRAFEAKASLLAIRRQLLRNRVDLYLALGGGFFENALSPEASTGTAF